MWQHDLIGVARLMEYACLGHSCPLLSAHPLRGQTSDQPGVAGRVKCDLIHGSEQVQTEARHKDCLQAAPKIPRACLSFTLLVRHG